jgi:hypothetical protein
VDNITRRSEGPPAGCAPMKEKAAGVPERVSARSRKGTRPMNHGKRLGQTPTPLARRNAAGRLPGGAPCEGEPHARCGEGVQETDLDAMIAGDERRGGNTRIVRPPSTAPWQRACALLHRENRMHGSMGAGWKRDRVTAPAGYPTINGGGRPRTRPDGRRGTEPRNQYTTDGGGRPRTAI